MKRGKLIVIDGLDGSGKGVQTGNLVDRLREEGHQVEIADFPQYGKYSAEFVAHYLRGEYGGPREVSAKKASIFYALDRFEASFQIKRWLEEGKIVISNRYASANKGHQLGKLDDPDEMNAFLEWENELEYDILGIPVPDVTIFLHMTPEIGQKLVDMKAAREYTRGEKRDIHESDINHLRDAERAYLFCFENDKSENWQKITCFEDNEPRTIPDIHEDVYKLVKETLEKK